MMPVMKMKNPKEKKRINEYEKQINYWKNKCGLTDKEAKEIMNYAKQKNIEPSRIVETIAKNAINEDGKWSVKTKVQDYDNAIKAMKKELEEIKKTPKDQKPKSKFVQFVEKLEKIVQKEDYETALKRKIKWYERIRDVLNEFSNDYELINKIKNQE
jgi:DNA primase catalytic subunit